MLKYILLSAYFLISFVPQGWALSYVLDTEINRIFRDILVELDAESAASVRLALGVSPEVNAFVTQNHDMFIFSGLIDKAQSIDQVQGVLAHELAHIKAGHLVKGQYAQEVAQKQALVTTILGLGAAVVGAPQAGGAVLMGGQAGAISGVLKHTRTAEAEADNLAAEMLSKQGYSLGGMVDFFRQLHTYTFLRFGAMPPYLLTHPLPAQRLEVLSRKLLAQGVKTKKVTVDFERLKAKVYALSHSPIQTLRKYGRKNDENALYAQAIAYTQMGDKKEAERVLDKLQSISPRDPYYIELAGDLALETGDIAMARTSYEQAQQTLKAPLIRYKLAQVEQAAGNTTAALSHAQGMFPAYAHFAPAWQLLGILYGKNGQKVAGHVALAEAAYRRGEKDAVRLHVAQAKNFMTDKTAGHLRAQVTSLETSLENL